MAQSTILGDTGNGATITFGTSSYAAKVRSIEAWTESIDDLDVSTLDSTGFKRKITSDLKDAGNIKVNVLFDTFLAPPTIGGAPETITITLPLRTGETTAGNYAGTAFVKEYSYPQLANGTIQEASYVICWTGATGPAYTKST